MAPEVRHTKRVLLSHECRNLFTPIVTRSDKFSSTSRQLHTCLLPFYGLVQWIVRVFGADWRDRLLTFAFVFSTLDQKPLYDAKLLFVPPRRS